MNLDEGIKLVVTLHIPSENLQREIIAKDMNLALLVESARAIELTQREVSFIKQNTMDPSTHKIETQQAGGDPVQPSASKYDTQRQKPTVQVCRYCGNRAHTVERVKPKEPHVIDVKRKGILQWFVSQNHASKLKGWNKVKKRNQNKKDMHLILLHTN